MRDDRPPVEWLVDDPLPEDVPTIRPRHRAVAALVFAVLAGAVVYVLVTRHAPAPPHAVLPAQTTPPIASPQPAPRTFGITGIDDTIGPPNALERDPAHCPDLVTCTSVASVPAATSDAVRSYLLGARERSHLSVVQDATDTLYYRSVEASSGDLQLLVVISRPGAQVEPPTLEADETASESIGYARLLVNGFEVQVQFTGPPGYHPSLDAARQLALDPRLLTLS